MLGRSSSSDKHQRYMLAQDRLEIRATGERWQRSSTAVDSTKLANAPCERTSVEHGECGGCLVPLPRDLATGPRRSAVRGDGHRKNVAAARNAHGRHIHAQDVGDDASARRLIGRNGLLIVARRRVAGAAVTCPRLRARPTVPAAMPVNLSLRRPQARPPLRSARGLVHGRRSRNLAERCLRPQFQAFAMLVVHRSASRSKLVRLLGDDSGPVLDINGSISCIRAVQG